MYRFMAIRIHKGKLTWDEVASFNDEAKAGIKAAYKALYPDEEIPEESETE